jgi:hypothetical protein
VIKKQYICDLCGVGKSELSEPEPWRRVKFCSDGAFVFVPLITSESASETIICAACLATLKKLLS